jgi:hypothetical protein
VSRRLLWSIRCSCDQAETLVLAAPFAPLLQKQPTLEELVERLVLAQAEAHKEGRPLLVRCSSVTKILTLGPLLVKRLADGLGRRDSSCTESYSGRWRSVRRCPTVRTAPGTVVGADGSSG